LKVLPESLQFPENGSQRIVCGCDCGFVSHWWGYRKICDDLGRLMGDGSFSQCALEME
jgi:hypothetical protein